MIDKIGTEINVGHRVAYTHYNRLCLGRVDKVCNVRVKVIDLELEAKRREVGMPAYADYVRPKQILVLEDYVEEEDG